MGSMYCDKCHRFGIYWKNLGGFNQHTCCPHCGGVNCQQIENETEDREADGSDTQQEGAS